MRVGFLGVGVMGQPMALNLSKQHEVVAWNRSDARMIALRDVGVRVASTVDQVFEECQLVLLMLANAAAIDSTLGRGTAQFHPRVHGHTVVHMGTTSPTYSEDLKRSVEAAGGNYVEAPVSGSRKPAEDAALVAMLAGADEVVEQVLPTLRSMCRQSFVCGQVPAALNMKLAVNLFLIVLVTGLAESVEFARTTGLDISILRDVLDAGPMASAVSVGKLAKLTADDFSVQAGLSDVLYNNVLIAEAARNRGAAVPLLDQAHELFAEAESLGYGTVDMVGVIHAIAARAAKSA